MPKPSTKPAEDKTPAKPGDTGFDWQNEYPGEDVFVFTASTGATVGLARLAGPRKPKPGVLRKLRKQDELGQMWAVIELVASEAALDVSDEFDDEDYGRMFEEWALWSKSTAGE